MDNLNKETSHLSKYSNLIYALSYGFFISYLVQVDLKNESGDIGSLINFFGNFYELDFFKQYFSFSNSVDYTFRYIIIIIHSITELEFLIILKTFSFVISSVIFYIFFIKKNQKNKSLSLHLLFFMIFLTPSVWDLWASGIRSGVAFILLLLSLIYLKGLKKYIAFFISILLHVSMIPFIVFYFLFNLLNNPKVNFSLTLIYSLLIFIGLTITYAASQFYYLEPVAQSFRYQILVYIIALIFIFLNIKAVRDLYGFLSVGIIFIVLIGFNFDLSFIRYVGNFLILFLFFLIHKGSKQSIQLTCISYFPYFTVHLYYSISNLI